MDEQPHGLAVASPARRWQLVGLAPALTLVVMAVALVRDHWQPTLDEAVISWRSWDVFSGPSPLVGQYSQASKTVTTPTYSPGPLLYWVLALPTRLAPDSGPAVAALLFGALCLFATGAAVARTFGPVVAVVVMVGTTIGVWSTAAEIGGAPVWNPYAALVPFGCSLLLGWVVAAGGLGWWPLLVFLASFTSQTHLMYAPAAILICLVTPVVGWRVGRGRAGWLLAGLAVGVVSWSAPVWQQLTTSPGNLTMLYRSTAGSSEPRTGLKSGLELLGSAIAGPRPIWTRTPHTATFPTLAHPHPSELVAVVALAALVALLVVAWRRGDVAMRAVLLVALLTDLGAVYVLAGVSVSQSITLAYISYVLWPASLVTWLAVGYALAPKVASRAPAVAPAPALAPALAAALAVGSLGLAGWAAGATPDFELRTPQRAAVIAAADATASQLGRPASDRQRIALEPAIANLGDGVSYLYATGYQLRRHGWRPALQPVWCASLDHVYCATGAEPRLRPGVGTSGRPLGTIAYPGTPAGTVTPVFVEPPGP